MAVVKLPAANAVLALGPVSFCCRCDRPMLVLCTHWIMGGAAGAPCAVRLRSCLNSGLRTGVGLTSVQCLALTHGEHPSPQQTSG
eukprot:5970223-Amphidinium_carterae.1